MRILVTGGAGFLGTHLCEALRGRGHTVFSCDLQSTGRENEMRADVGQYRQLEAVMDRAEPELVYHMAAEFGRNNGEDYYEQVWHTNAVGTKNILRLQKWQKFKLVYFSSSEVYGDYPGIMSESVMAEQPTRQLNDYAISKWVGEQQVMNAIDRTGAQAVRVRLFNTYGPGERWTPYRSVITHFVHCALHDKPFKVFLGYKRTSTYVEDMIRTLGNISENFVPGAVYNIAGEEFHDIKKVSDLVLAMLGKSDSLVEYQTLDAHNTVNKQPDISAAKLDLAHRCETGLEAGIERTIQWHRALV